MKWCTQYVIVERNKSEESSTEIYNAGGGQILVVVRSRLQTIRGRGTDDAIDDERCDAYRDSFFSGEIKSCSHCSGEVDSKWVFTGVGGSVSDLKHIISA